MIIGEMIDFYGVKRGYSDVYLFCWLYVMIIHLINILMLADIHIKTLCEPSLNQIGIP